MDNDKDVLPSDAEDASLKPQSPDARKPPQPQVDEKTEEDPSEQPS